MSIDDDVFSYLLTRGPWRGPSRPPTQEAGDGGPNAGLNGVFVLHGPPCHPRYYGQLERQNREHRQYLSAVHPPTDARQLAGVCAEMLVALNTIWPRRALGWRTPAQAWATRPTITAAERADFCAQVYDRYGRLEQDHNMTSDMAMRLAIEQALQTSGYLRVERPNGAD